MKNRTGFVSNSSSSSFLVSVKQNTELHSFLNFFMKLKSRSSDDSIYVCTGEQYAYESEQELQSPSGEDLFYISTPYGAEGFVSDLREHGAKLVEEIC